MRKLKLSMESTWFSEDRKKCWGVVQQVGEVMGPYVVSIQRMYNLIQRLDT